MYQDSVKSSEAEAAKPQQATCEVHTSQPLALYCETCEKLVCRDCILMSCAGKNHKHGYVEEMVKKYDSIISSAEEPVKELSQKLSSSLEALLILKEELHQEKEKRLHEIQEHFHAITEILQEEKQHFTEITETFFCDQLKLYTAKEEELSEALMKVKKAAHLVDTAPRNESFLASVAETERRIKQGKKAALNALDSKPERLPEIAINLCAVERLRDMMLLRNFTYTKSDPLKCHIERTTFTVGEEKNLSLHVNLENIKTGPFKKFNFTVQLHCRHDCTCQIVSVKKITGETYLLSFSPKQRGEHDLVVRLNDDFLCQIPIYVTMPPHKLNMLSYHQIDNAAGIKFISGKLYVVQEKEFVLTLNPQTLAIEETIQIPGVFEILVKDSHIYATDILKNRLIKMSMNGTILDSIGTRGEGSKQFNFPNGIRLSKDNELYVCDSSNHRVKVFDADLKLFRILGEKGTADGCLNWPADLDFDEDGNIYVAELRNNRVQVLTPQGQHIRNIGRPGSGQGELHHPISVAVHRGVVYVTDSNNKRVSTFKSSGEFVSTFGEDILTGPECIAIDENGFVYVSDGRKRIVKF